MGYYLGDLPLLPPQEVHDSIGLLRLHILVIVARVEVAPVLGPVRLHQALHCDEWLQPLLVPVQVQACPPAKGAVNTVQ